jgi:phosphoribosylaminoimidazole (AIR) synthetase
VFNMGLGLLVVIRPDTLDAVSKRLTKQGFTPRLVGGVIAGDRAVTYLN